jgi:hypothetical protein
MSKTKYYIIINYTNGVKWLWNVIYCTETEIKERITRYNDNTIASGVYYTYTTRLSI